MAKKTVFPNGINRKVAILSGGTAGQNAVATTFGIKDDDVLEQAVRVTMTGNSNGAAIVFSSAADITDDCALTTDGYLSTGTNYTGALIFAYFADQDPNS
jgi:hypothetical protein